MNGHDDAVSPIVGVMLLLVVTLIIAAVVSGFASGIYDPEKKSSDAQIKFVGAGFDAGHGGLIFEHLGGEPIDLRYIGTHLMNGNTQAEFTSNDELAKDHGRYDKGPPDNLADDVYHRFEKVGDMTRNHKTHYIEAGDQFIIYSDVYMPDYYGMGTYMGFKAYRDDECYTSIGLFSGNIKHYTVFDTKSNRIYTEGTLCFPDEA